MRGDIQPGSRGAAMSRTATYFCWACYAPVDGAEGRCPACGHASAPPPGTSFTERLLWTLGHPLVERRMVAIGVLAERGERRAVPRLRELAGDARDPYLAAAALQAAVSIEGPEASRALLLAARNRPVPARRAAQRLLDATDSGDRQGPERRAATSRAGQPAPTATLYERRR